MGKYLGLLCLVLAGVFGLVRALQKEKKRLEVARQWAELIATVRHKIDCYLSPLDKILSELGSPAGRSALTSLLKDSRPYLSEKQYALIEEFTVYIGQGFREEQLVLCDRILAALAPLYQQQEAEHPRRVRVLTALSVCIPLSLVIFLW